MNAERPRSVPLCPAWGLHMPLSYQRPAYRQISLEDATRIAIDEPAAWGANYVDLYPSNKESVFPDDEDYHHKMWAQYAFKEIPDDAQEHPWTIDTFRAFNEYAHGRGYLVAWFLHHKFPYDSKEEWWRIVSGIHRELAEKVCDVCADGWGAQVDGLGSEGHSVPPEKIPELIWDEHPGLFTREASSVYDYAAPHHIRSYAFHLSDGRDYFYGGARWNKPDYPIEVYQGKPVRLKHGAEFVGCQAEARDIVCDDPGWGAFSGLAGADAVVEQMSNLYRAKMVAPHEAATTATWWINEPLISERMRRYVFGVSQDPVRAAVAAELFTTAADGPFPRVAHPKGTHFIQNNYFRAYVRDDGRIELHADVAGRANYTDFLETTRRLVTEDLLLVDVGHTPPSSCRIERVEEAGALAALKVRVTYDASFGHVTDEYLLRLVADSPVLSIDVHRQCDGAAQTVATRIGLEACGWPASIKSGAWFPAKGRFDSPVVNVRLTHPNDPAREWPLRHQHACTILDDDAQETRLTIDIALGTNVIDTPPAPCIAPGETIPNEAGYGGACAVRVTRDKGGPYWVREDGWWIVRGAQPSLRDPAIDLVKVYLSRDHEARICPSGFLAGSIAPGWGCQYVLRFRDVESDAATVSATVSVEDVSPILFAPRVNLPWSVGAVKLDGDDWHYFDAEHVFLPNRRGTYHLEVREGRPQVPRVVVTFATVRATRWDGHTFIVDTELPSWVHGVPDGYRFRMAVRAPSGPLRSVDGARVVRQESRGREAWTTLLFDAGRIAVVF